jgi:hypothetical protein
VRVLRELDRKTRSDRETLVTGGLFTFRDGKAAIKELLLTKRKSARVRE